MAVNSSDNGPPERETPPEYVAGGVQWSPLATAALVGGAVAATAGAWLGTRALARRNAIGGKPLNSVMANAITASEVSHRQPAPKADKEPVVPHEPDVATEPRA